MIKTTRTDFAQTYIPHGYVEICMPAVKTEVCMLSLLLYLRISLSDLTVLLACGGSGVNYQLPLPPYSRQIDIS